MSKIHLSVLDKSFDVTISPSFLSEAECPASVKYGRIDKLPRRTDLPLEVGRSVHKIFERVIHLRMAGKPVDDGALEAIMNDAVRGAAVTEIGEIRRMTSLFLTNFNPRLDTIVGVEEQVALDEAGNPTSWDEAAYGGYLDLVQIEGKTGRVTDHKAQWNILSREELDRHFQLTFYLMLLRKLYPFLRHFEASINYARHGFSVVTQRSSEQLDACEQEVMIRVEAIRRWKNFDPVVGQHCTICDARFDCPKGRDLSDVPDAVISPEQAVSAAGRLRVMEIVVKELRKRLRVYCETNGDVDASPTWRVGFVQQKKVEYPPAVEERLRHHGIDPAQFRRVDGVAIKKLLKQLAHHDPDVFADIMSVAVVKLATTFKGYKPGSEDEEDEP